MQPDLLMTKLQLIQFTINDWFTAEDNNNNAFTNNTFTIA